MITTRSNLGIAFITVTLFTGFGCATKGYVKMKVDPVAANVAALDAKTTQMADKEATDVSRLDEQIQSTDAKASQALTTAQAANQLGQQNQAALAADQAANQSKFAAADSAINNLDKSMSYSLVAKGDVTFAFNKSNLSKSDQAALDLLIAQVQSMPRTEFELVGFTDQVGGSAYNLTLSRQRSEAVARYLVHHGVSLQGIHIIGFGKEPVPPSLLADAQAVNPNATDANSRRLARRVLIRIYAPNGNVEQSASLQ